MLKKNSKSMFFILLTPLYLLLLMCLVGMSMGSIEWLNAAFIAIVLIAAAWGLSNQNSIFANFMGLFCFIGLSVQFIYPTLTRTDRIGPWTISLYAGAILAFFGLIAFIYNLNRMNRHKKL